MLIKSWQKLDLKDWTILFKRSIVEAQAKNHLLLREINFVFCLFLGQAKDSHSRQPSSQPMPRAAVRSNAGCAAEHGCGQSKEPRRIFANCQQHLQSRETVQRAGREFLFALVCAEHVHSLHNSRGGLRHHLSSLTCSPWGVRSNRGH